MPGPVPCLQCLALVRPGDMPAHEAWHTGLIEALIVIVKGE